MAVRWCAAWLVVKFPLSYERTPLVYHLKLVIGEMHHTKEQILDGFCSNSACHIRCALERVEVPYRPSGRRHGEARHVELCLRWPWLRFALGRRAAAARGPAPSAAQSLPRRSS